MSANDPFSVPKKHALNLKARFENMAQQGEEEAKQRAEEEKKRREARDRKEREEAKKREEQRKKAEEEEYERKRQADEQKRYIRVLGTIFKNCTSLQMFPGVNVLKHFSFITNDETQ